MGAQDLFSFQGRVLLAERQANGKPAAMRFVGNASLLQLQLTAENTDKTESFSGSRGLYGRLNRSKAITVSLTLDEWLPANIALGLYSKPITLEGGTVTAEPFPPGLVAGDLVRLDHPFVSNVVLSDGAEPAAPVPPAAYVLDSPNAGLVKIVDPTGLAQPFTAAYSHASADSLAMFTEKPPERWLMLDGINTVNQQPVVLELYRLQFDPLGTLDAINEEYGELALTGAGLIDADKVPDETLGGFGRILQKRAA
ncbi:Phage protein [plant metagenome]|uniref:Phage protein n=1 Tax=plant metagenome TaxID=1297885 RepID=A0A484Q8P9_9ZZZZ